MAKKQQIKTSQVYVHKESGHIAQVTAASFALHAYSGLFKHQLCTENEQGVLVVMFVTTKELLDNYEYLDSLD